LIFRIVFYYLIPMGVCMVLSVNSSSVIHFVSTVFKRCK